MARGSVSGLLRSAASIRNQLANYQDSAMAYEYSNSAYTDTAYSAYSAYLKSRIAALNAAPSVSNMSKALSLTKALDAAGKKNISATIQRENIQVLSGNASLTDKYNVISNEFVRAQQNGDMTLAQQLEGQAYSLSQTIQKQAQDSATANAANDGKNWADTAQTLTDQLKQFNTDYTNAGRSASTKVIADFVKSISPQLAKAGIILKPGMQPNYFDIVDGVNRAIYKSYQNAATVSAPYDTSGVTTRSYIDKANAALTSIPTIYGKMDAQTLQQAVANPQQYTYREDPQYVPANNSNNPGGDRNPQVGYQMTQNGIQPVFSPLPTVQSKIIDIPTNLSNKIQALGLDVLHKQGSNDSSSANAIEVAPTSKTPAWLAKILPNDSTTHVISDASGQIQFEADSQHGQGKSVYTLAKDGTVWESNNTGDYMVQGNPNQEIQKQPQSLFGTISDAFRAGTRDVATLLNYGGGLLNGHAFAATMSPDQMLALQGSLKNPASSPAIPIPVSAKPLQLPALNLSAPTPVPHVDVAPAINAYPTAPTVNPQQTAPSPTIQSGSQGISLQGGSGGLSLQGGGISLQ